MILRILLTAALLVPSAHAADFDRALATSAQPDLYVTTGSGHIHVFPGSGSEIKVRAHVYAGWHSSGDVEDRIRRISQNPPIRQEGNAIRFGDVPDGDRKLYDNITIDYEISAPFSVALYLRTGSGDIQADNLGRSLKAETGSGSVRAHGISGPADMHSGSGDIELQQRAPGDVVAQSGSGSIRVNGLAGSLTARTGSGDIEANGSLTGAARLQSGSGSIRVHIGSSAHYNLDASTGSGSIRFPGSYKSDAHHIAMPVNGGGPAIDARTGSGDIQID